MTQLHQPTFIKLQLVLVLLGAELPGQDAQPEPFARERLVFVTRIGEAEIARETTKLTPTGWSTEGSFDVLGTRKGAFRASWTSAPSGKRYEMSRRPEIEGYLLCVIADGRMTASITGPTAKGGERSSKLDDSGGVFAFDNLIWAGLVDLGRVLAAREAAGTLTPGATITGIAVASAFPAEHVESTPSKQVVLGQEVTLRVSTLKLPGNLEMTVVTTQQGLPLRVEVPAQKVSVVVEGFEAVMGARGEPTSIVDSGAWRAKLSAPTHKVVVDKKVMLRMRDGVSLAIDLYRPDGAGPFPTILARTPYNRTTEGAMKGAFYACRGYAFVAQDVRGRFDSQGEWFPFLHDEHDGSDTLDWIGEQKWSDGKVGMVGASYVGLVQWLAAKSGNRHLRCIVPQVSPPDPHENFPYEGGALLMGAAWWARVLEAMKLGTDWRQGVDWNKAFATLPLSDLDEGLNLKEETFLDTWLAHPPHDTAFWAPARYQHLLGTIDIPAFHVTGWWDGDLPGAIMNFPGMRRAAKTARDDQYLVIGPWTHFFNSARRMGDVDFGNEAVIDLDARIVRFFDRYLKGVDNGIEEEPRVHVFTMGSNQWHGEADWPLPQARPTKLFLASHGNAKRRDGDGRLDLVAPTSADAGSVTYRYDPMRQEAPDLDFEDLSGAEAVADKSDEPDRDDDLEFTSPPLRQPCEIMGPVEVLLHVSTDAADTDFVAGIYRLTKDGKRFGMRGGIQRLRYATDPLRDVPIPPGTVTRLTIDCWALGQRLDTGDRLQVVISSTAWPGYARNLNTLEPQATAKEAVVATNTVYHDAERRSHLLLPVVPRRDAPGLAFAPR